MFFRARSRKTEQGCCKAQFSSYHSPVSPKQEEKVFASSGLLAELGAAWTAEEALVAAEDSPTLSLSRAAELFLQISST